MSMYAAFKTDPTKETEGVVVDFGEFRCTVRRAGGLNKAFQKTMETLVTPYRRIIQLGTMPEGKMKEILAEGYAKSIITKWEYLKVTDSEDGLSEPKSEWVVGIETPDGSIVEPTPDAIKAVLIAQPDIFDMIKEVADNLRNFRTDDDEAARKN